MEGENAVANPVGMEAILPGRMVVDIVDVTSRPMAPLVPFDGMDADGWSFLTRTLC